MEGYEDLVPKKSSSADSYADLVPKKTGSKQDMNLGSILEESQEAYKTSPAGRFGETFAPVKAVTEQGIIPQLYQYGKRKLTGEAAPKAEEAPEKPVGFMKSLGDMASYAKKDPGAFAGQIANAIVADPELLFLPELLPARVVSSVGKVGKVADAATTAGAQAAGQSAARQLNERGKIDMNVLRQDALNAASLSGGARIVGEAGRAALPGAKKFATEGTLNLIDEARKRGYTIPAGAMSPLGAIIDKYYRSPIKSINKKQFYEEISAPTGTQVSEINTKTLPQIESNLETEINNVLRNTQVSVPQQFSDAIRTFLPYQKGTIENALVSIENGLPIKGETWHTVRSELGRRRANALQSNPVMADDINNVIKQWDAIAQGQFPQKVQDGFNTWKTKYQAFKDIDDAVLSNKTAYEKYLNGELEPSDVMSSIRQRRKSETRAPQAGKPQTETAALATGLDLLGETTPKSLGITGIIPREALRIAAKPIQAGMYTRPGQELLYRGLGQTGVAPYTGPVLERARQESQK